MYFKKLTKRHWRFRKNYLPLLAAFAFSFGCHKSNVDQKDLRDFQQVNLVANNNEYNANHIDSTLLNAFGMAWTSNGFAWVNSVGGHVSEIYNSEGVKQRAVNIPSSASPADSNGGFPCGIVLSSGKGFNLRNGPSSFLFSGFEGGLTGWNPASGNNAQFILHPPQASFTGLAIGSSAGRNFIYAANFGAKKINVWDTTFTRIDMSFKDPTLPDDYSPYNIQAVGDSLFVMYAKLKTTDPGAGHGIAGDGFGYVSVFSTDGTFGRRFASQGTLNIPWGVTMAPASFLQDKDVNRSGNNNDGYGATNSPVNNNSANQENHYLNEPVILIGNFGDGRINVFSLDAKFLGQLQTHKHTLVIDGLWALSFPPASANIDAGRLYFTAGPDSEQDGVFGYIIKK
ncbi:MAG TPA: TIGR03118 family protein [Puia sp.]|jgi:uncharacterized protein (TIGR03118 family)